MKNILFLGLGHLGEFFLQQNQKHKITGTSRSAVKEVSCPIISYSLGEKWQGPTDFDTVIISFPPMSGYAQKIEGLLHQLGSSQQIIFISSTSLFGSGRITEESPKDGVSRNADELRQCEDIIQKQENSLILRPSGLVDEKRHPQNFLKKVTTIRNSQNNVNLVHTSDVAAFLHFAIDHNLTNDDFNLTCDDHPTKQELYSRFSDHIIFEPEDETLRIIDNTKSKNIGFSYHYPRLDWL